MSTRRLTPSTKVITPRHERHHAASEQTFTLTYDFFQHPAPHIIPQLRSAFAIWLTGFGILQVRAQSLSQRLDSYFAVAIHNEWRSDPKYHEPIRDVLHSPFLAAAENELAWQSYTTHIARMVDEPVFGEAFSLRLIYIQPRGYFSTKPGEAQDSIAPKRFSAHGHAGEGRQEVIAVMAELRRWVKLRDKENAIRVLSGGPGSGKSSCAKLLAHMLLSEDHTKTIFVPLHLLNVQMDFQSAMTDFLAGEGFFSRNPLAEASASDPVVLILDGLDELEMQGRGAQEIAQQFVAELARTLSILNNQECRLLAIISGRELAVQSVEGSFRRPGQVLHLLPYFVPNPSHAEYHDPQGLLKEDQRDEWWQRYGRLIDQKFSGTPQALRDGELGEVTAQPLLNYLVALAFQRGGLQLSSETSVNAIYGDLVKAVYERGWSRHHHPAVRGISEAAFVRFLEEIALSAWHGRGRTTTLREIEDHCKVSGLGTMIPEFERGASSSISALLLAFISGKKDEAKRGIKPSNSPTRVLENT